MPPSASSSDDTEIDFGQDIKTAIALLKRDIKYLGGTLERIEKKLNDDYVSNDRFDPVKNVVYGLVGVILTTVVGALLYVVLNMRPH